MKKPDSVDADLFKRAELLKDGRDVDRPHAENRVGCHLPTDPAKKRSFELACADRWELLEIIAELESDRENIKRAAFEDGYEQCFEDMVSDGWREPR